MVFIVWVIPHGDLLYFIGVFSTIEKAQKAKEFWMTQFPASNYKPLIEEIELDKIYSGLTKRTQAR